MQTMKNLVVITPLIALVFGSFCSCSMFDTSSQSAGYRTETRQVKTCSYDIIRREINCPGDSKSGKSGMTEIVEEKVPRYKTVTKRVRVPRSACFHFYCTTSDFCGTTSAATIAMSSAQGSNGSPNLGLIPTMKKITP